MNTDFYKLGIIGKPLSHSISPVIQKTALDSVKLGGSYEKFEIDAENIFKALEFFKKSNYKGFNVTIPYKVEILKYLDQVAESAKNIGAVNTVKISKNGSLMGFNTDISGFYSSVLKKREKIENAILFGSGGAAQAVVFGLKDLGCKHICVYTRNFGKTKIFVEKLKDKTNIDFSVKLIEDNITFEKANILINSTPLGTKGENENLSVVSKNSLESLNKDALIYDLVYNPQETLLIKYAKELGFDYINGLEMLIMQGAEAFKIWTGLEPDIKKMQDSARKYFLNI
ncbi:MAG: shikimate dehydrogenase [Candidatus Gastranaerophilales bacterium]|nr:shikimate dehydrogenase [Candidatus Gastranaerophilales bacterium]